MEDEDRILVVQTAGIISSAIAANLVGKDEIPKLIADVSKALRETFKVKSDRT